MVHTIIGESERRRRLWENGKWLIVIGSLYASVKTASMSRFMSSNRARRIPQSIMTRYMWHKVPWTLLSCYSAKRQSSYPLILLLVRTYTNACKKFKNSEYFKTTRCMCIVVLMIFNVSKSKLWQFSLFVFWFPPGLGNRTLYNMR